MKHSVVMLSVICGLVFSFASGCKKDKEEKEEIIRPVKTIVVGSIQNITDRTFPGITEEAQSVDLAFRVGGPLIKLNATRGQRVKRGQLIAEIDPRDFKTDLLAKEARYIQAQADKERFEATYERGSIPKMEYDQKQAFYLEAKSAYENAKHALTDTRLRAPFDGYIDEKLVENYERVNIGQTIVTLFNLSSIEVHFSIPETMAIYYQEFENFTVTFDVFKDEPFIADLKEIGKKSEKSAGIPVILVLPNTNMPDSKQVIIPGMACQVKVNLKETAEETSLKMEHFPIPTSSVYAQPDSDKKYVFIVNKEKMTVSKTEVKLGSLVTNNVIMAEYGLKQGDLLVTAGAKILQDGQKVKFLN